eukprot:snap_masked-scaffold_23-processed-gene-2.28-mRNA-1 protein AED:1.00 eAED:1.00 QI:0/0/0/0/1/1/2/0/67
MDVTQIIQQEEHCRSGARIGFQYGYNPSSFWLFYGMKLVVKEVPNFLAKHFGRYLLYKNQPDLQYYD